MLTREMVMKETKPTYKKKYFIKGGDELDRHVENTNELHLKTQSISNRQIFIVDVFNPLIFPHDAEAKKSIDIEVKVTSKDDDGSYIKKVINALDTCQKSFQPDFIIYNAGTDILAGDHLGNLNISEQGIITRDEIVFKFAFESQTPVLMLLSGGYQKSNALIIAKSILNLAQKFPFLAFKPQKV